MIERPFSLLENQMQVCVFPVSHSLFSAPSYLLLPAKKAIVMFVRGSSEKPFSLLPFFSPSFSLLLLVSSWTSLSGFSYPFLYSLSFGRSFGRGFFSPEKHWLHLRMKHAFAPHLLPLDYGLSFSLSLTLCVHEPLCVPVSFLAFESCKTCTSNCVWSGSTTGRREGRSGHHWQSH